MEEVIGRIRSSIMTVLFWVLSLAGLGLLFLVVALPVVRQRYALEQKVAQMSVRVDALTGQRDRLWKEETALLSDPFYVEKLARRDLRMCRAGEMTVSVVPARSPQKPAGKVIPAHAEGLYGIYGSLKSLAEDNFFRRGALLIALLSLTGAVLLFGRQPKVGPAHAKN